MNTIGHLFRISIFGESHGACVGCLVDGAPPGLPCTPETLQPALDRRRPGQSAVTTTRAESDRCEVLSGVYEGRTTGAPILLLIRNQDTDSSKYAEFRNRPRPGHADYTGRIRFQDHNDHRGGGQFSGRLTAPWVMAGALAHAALALSGIEIAAHTVRIGAVTAPGGRTVAHIRRHVETNPVRCADPDAAKRMEETILKARTEKDSVGGVVECVAEGLPPGLGTPTFAKLDAMLAHAVLSLPAVKGFSIGSGFDSGDLHGSQHNDPFTYDAAGRVRTSTNHAGGLLGGITTGMPLAVRVAFKPASSIARAQHTVDLARGQPAELVVEGRHDPSVVPRAVPVVEAVVACVLLDAMLAPREAHGRP